MRAAAAVLALLLAAQPAAGLLPGGPVGSRALHCHRHRHHPRPHRLVRLPASDADDEEEVLAELAALAKESQAKASFDALAAEALASVGSLGPEEQKASDRRVVEGMFADSDAATANLVQSFRQELNATKATLLADSAARAAAQGAALEVSIDAKIDGFLSSVAEADDPTLPAGSGRLRSILRAAPADDAADSAAAAPAPAPAAPSTGVVLAGAPATPLAAAAVAALAAQGVTATTAALDDAGAAAAAASVDVVVVCPAEKDVDPAAVEAVAKALPASSRCVLASCVGVERAGEFPFSMSNMWGALDRRRAAEQAVRLASQTRGFSHTVLRLGKLDAGASGAVALVPGDAFDAKQGVSPGVAAAAVAQAATAQYAAANATASLVGSGNGEEVAQAAWDDLFLALDGPELCRLGTAGLSRDDVLTWAHDWGRAFEKGAKGSGLTTPVNVGRTPAGVRLSFRPKDAPPRSLEGGVEVVVEDGRVRAKRCDYGDEAVVKVMSEEVILRRLKKDVAALVERRG